MAKASETPKASGVSDTGGAQPSSSRRIQIKQAYLHQAIMLPMGLGTEKHLGKASQADLTLEWGPEGLWMTHVPSGMQTIIPHANVASAVVK